ncbi:MAG: FG-GAP repeat protein [Bacteroidetes bacterium]|nr:FG-GAP repeat protein [Bacteroidota bacterium]
MKSKWYLLPITAAIAIGAIAISHFGSSKQPAEIQKPTVQSAKAGIDQNWYASVTQDIAKSEYFIRYQESAKSYQSPNRSQNLRITYFNDGFSLSPRAQGNDTWNVDMRLTSVSKGEKGLSLAGTDIQVKDNRMTAENADIQIEYLNKPEGMRQNFLVKNKPAGNLPLTLTLKTSTNLKARQEGNDGVLFVDKTNKSKGKVWYKDLNVWDASHNKLSAKMELRGTMLDLVVDDRNAVYPVTVDPLSTTANWTAESNQADGEMGWSITQAGDINGDSFVDVLVGCPRYDNGETDEGAVFVYNGSATGLGATPSKILEINMANANFGWSVSTAGDVNKDGYRDIIVGAPTYGNGQASEGAIFVFLGSATGVTTTPAATRESDQAGAQFGYSVGIAGRINADDSADVIVGAPYFDNGEIDEGRVYVFFGGKTGLRSDAPWTAESNQDAARMGWSVAGNADFNRDGKSDIAVGVPLWDNGQTNEGVVYVYYGIPAGGLPATPNWTRESNQNDAQFGYSVANAGDVNGDGSADLLVGAPFFSNGESNEGRVMAYYGGTTGLSTTESWTAESNQVNARFGHSVASAGDINNDGNSDIIIGAPLYDAGENDEGRVFIYQGSTIGLSSVVAWITEGNQINAQYGTSVAGIGDVNGDGYGDVAVGAPFFDNGELDEGRAFAYYGSASGIGNAAAVFESNKVAGFMGFSVASAGDVNGDGYSDMIVGVPGGDYGQLSEGKAFVFQGSASGLSTTPLWSFESNQVGAALGYSVSTAGDVNADGYSDIIIGAPLYDSIQTDKGRVFVFLGGGSGPSVAPSWIGEMNQAGAQFGSSVACVGDLNKDTYSDIAIGAPYADSGQTDEGMVFVYRGSLLGVNPTPAWIGEGNQTNAHYGASIAGANDINGDGYSDLVIGAPEANADVDAALEGRVYAYFGSTTFPQASPSWTGDTQQDGAQFGESVSSAGDVNGDGFCDLIVGIPNYENGQIGEGRAVVYYGSVNGPGPVANWTMEVNQVGASFGEAVSGGGDVNGDGYADVIVGAPNYTNGQQNEGGMFVYFGSSTGPSLVPNMTAESDQANAQFGAAVANAGDFNGDGYSDIYAGCPAYDNGQNDEGRVYVYAGKYNGLTATPNWATEGAQAFAEHGFSVAAAGDVNGDGYADVLVSAPYFDAAFIDEGRVYLYLGSATGLSATPINALSPVAQEGALFGWKISGAGDINADGFADVLVGVPYFDGVNRNEVDEGRVYIYYGSQSGLASNPTLIENHQIGSLFGFAVAGVGDVNNDGYSDIAIGAPRYDNTLSDEGRVTVYYGSISGVKLTVPWIQDGEQLGAYYGNSIAGAGDVNRDGISDMIVGAYLYDNGQTDEGRAYIYYGTTNGLSTTAAWTSESNQEGANYGFTVAGGGDVNGDGYSDVIVSAIWYDGSFSNEGRVYLYNGGANGASNTPSWTATGGQTAVEFGKSISAAGDVNGDGYGDILVGSPLFDNGTQLDAGRVYLYNGSSAGLSTASWMGDPNQENTEFGNSVAGLGDVNGDGYADFAVGARRFDNTLKDRGRASVFYGNGIAGTQVNPRQFRPDYTATIVPALRTQSPNSVGLAVFGKTPAGRVEVKAQFEVKPINVAYNSNGLIVTNSWTSVGNSGVVLNQVVNGLTNATPYKWRVRFQYRPSNGALQPYSRWYDNGFDAPTEADFRTGSVCNLLVSAGPDITVCSGNAKVIGKVATGGLAPVTYMWEPTLGLSSATIPTPLATPQVTTTYIVTANDANGCISHDTVVVEVKPNLSVTTGEDVFVCSGESVQLNSQLTGGTAPFSYAWSPSFWLNSGSIPNPIASPSSNTQYILTVTDANNCVSRDTINVGVNPLAIRPEITQVNDTLISTPSAKYQWAKEGKDIPGATAQKYNFTATGRGNYSVTITNENGCRATSNPRFVNPLGVDEELTSIGVTIFPNPVHNELTLQADIERPVAVRIMIDNLVGGRMLTITETAQAGNYRKNIELTTLPSGVYLLHIYIDGKHGVRKIIKE